MVATTRRAFQIETAEAAVTVVTCIWAAAVWTGARLTFLISCCSRTLSSTLATCIDCATVLVDGERLPVEEGPEIGVRRDGEHLPVKPQAVGVRQRGSRSNNHHDNPIARPCVRQSPFDVARPPHQIQEPPNRVDREQNQTGGERRMDVRPNCKQNARRRPCESPRPTALENQQQRAETCEAAQLGTDHFEMLIRHK